MGIQVGVNPIITAGTGVNEQPPKVSPAPPVGYREFIGPGKLCCEVPFTVEYDQESLAKVFQELSKTPIDSYINGEKIGTMTNLRREGDAIIGSYKPLSIPPEKVSDTPKSDK